MGQLFETMLCETTVCETMFELLCINGQNLKFDHVILEPKMAQFCQRCVFFRKTIDIIFVYLLTLFIVQNLKKTVIADP